MCALQEHEALQRQSEQLASSRASYAEELAALQREAAGLKQVRLPCLTIHCIHSPSKVILQYLNLRSWDVKMGLSIACIAFLRHGLPNATVQPSANP